MLTAKGSMVCIECRPGKPTHLNKQNYLIIEKFFCQTAVPAVDISQTQYITIGVTH